MSTKGEQPKNTPQTDLSPTQASSPQQTSQPRDALHKDTFAFYEALFQSVLQVIDTCPDVDSLRQALCDLRMRLLKQLGQLGEAAEDRAEAPFDPEEEALFQSVLRNAEKYWESKRLQETFFNALSAHLEQAEQSCDWAREVRDELERTWTK